MANVAEQQFLFPPSDGDGVAAVVPEASVLDLATRLHERWGGRLRLGTSSWYFPGWQGMVWAHAETPQRLARQGLAAYARHPLLRTVSLDRAFYRPLDATTYAALAAQVPDHFRFLVKAPSLITDATQRDPANGAALRPNPHFLDAALALQACVLPAAAGLADKLGVLLFQLSPLHTRWQRDEAAFHEQLTLMFKAVLPALPAGAQVALELRDAVLLTPALAALLRGLDVRLCLGLHDRLPAIADQLPLLRALWPADLVCRWNLRRGLRYAQARDAWAPFNRLQAPDEDTRRELARVARATLDAGRQVFITINNKAEGSAPASVLELAREIDAPS